MPRRLLIASLAAAAVALIAPAASAERIKDIVDIQGVRSNPLQGYGLVVGLAGTGDTTDLTPRALANVLRRQGLSVDPQDLDGQNVASVIVRAELPPFAGRGQRIDVEVSTIGDATSLQGGTLLITPLRGADARVYAVAHGPVEREEPATFVQNGTLTLNLKNPDFSTAEDIRAAVDAVFPAAAETLDAGTVRIQVPQGLSRSRVAALIDRVGLLEVNVDAPALVVINERTGTIIVGENVGISTVAISHGNLSIVSARTSESRRWRSRTATCRSSPRRRTTSRSRSRSHGPGPRRGRIERTLRPSKRRGP